MKITKIDTFSVGAGWKNFLFIHVHTDTGLIGLGEGTPETIPVRRRHYRHRHVLLFQPGEPLAQGSARLIVKDDALHNSPGALSCPGRTRPQAGMATVPIGAHVHFAK